MTKLSERELILSMKFLYRDIGTVSRLAKGEALAPYIGLVGYRNLGDELLYQAHQKLFPNHKLEPYRQDTVYVEKVADSIRHPFCKHAILGGGTLINDGDIWLSKTEHLLDRGTRMFCLGTGSNMPIDFSKAESPLLKRWAKALAQFEFVGVRGPYSKKVLDNAGIENVVVTGDTALAMTEDSVPSVKSQSIVGINYGEIKQPYEAQYRDEMIKVIQTLIAQGHKVLLLPIWEGDVESNRKLNQLIAHPACQVIEVFDSYKKYADALRKCDFFIGQKLHSTVIALMNRIPSIMLEYKPKCRDFMASLGLEKYTIRTSDFTLETYQELHDELEQRYPSIKAQIEIKLLDFKNIQLNHAKRLNEILSH
jgi:exopolysaccharide biosynthesis predicted pyruvyltransferase EpsI